MVAKNKNIFIIPIAVLILAILAALGKFKSQLYGYCLASEICSMPQLAGVEIRMASNWIPEVYGLDGSTKVLAFDKDGKSRIDGGITIKFIQDAATTNILAKRFTRKTYKWGVGYEGTSEQIADISPSQTLVFYLAEPESGMWATSNSSEAFTEIVRIHLLKRINGVTH